MGVGVSYLIKGKNMSTKNREYWYFEGTDQNVYFPEGVINKEKYREGFFKGFAEAKCFITVPDDFMDKNPDFIMGYYDGREEFKCQSYSLQQAILRDNYCSNICWQDIKWFDETNDNYDLNNVHYIKDDKRIIRPKSIEALLANDKNINQIILADIKAEPKKQSHLSESERLTKGSVRIEQNGLSDNIKNRNKVVQLVYELEKFNAQLNEINILKEDLSEVITYKTFKNAVEILVVIDTLYQNQTDVLTDRNKQKLFDIIQTLLCVSYEQKDDAAIDKLESVYDSIFSEFARKSTFIVTTDVYEDIRRTGKPDNIEIIDNKSNIEDKRSEDWYGEDDEVSTEVVNDGVIDTDIIDGQISSEEIESPVTNFTNGSKVNLSLESNVITVASLKDFTKFATPIPIIVNTKADFLDRAGKVSDIKDIENSEVEIIDFENLVEENKNILDEGRENQRAKEFYKEAVVELLIKEIGDAIVETVREQLDNWIDQEEEKSLLHKGHKEVESLEEERIGEESLKELPKAPTLSGGLEDLSIDEAPLEETVTEIPVEKIADEISIEKIVEDIEELSIEEVENVVPVEADIEETSIEEFVGMIPIEVDIDMTSIGAVEDDILVKELEESFPLDEIVKEPVIEEPAIEEQEEGPIEEFVDVVPIEEFVDVVPIEDVIEEAPKDKIIDDENTEKTYAAENTPKDSLKKDNREPLLKRIKRWLLNRG